MGIGIDEHSAIAMRLLEGQCDIHLESSRKCYCDWFAAVHGYRAGLLNLLEILEGIDFDRVETPEEMVRLKHNLADLKLGLQDYTSKLAFEVKELDPPAYFPDLDRE